MTMIRAQQHVLMAPNDGNGSAGGAPGGGAGAGGGAAGAAGGAGGQGGSGGAGASEEVSEVVKKYMNDSLTGALGNWGKRFESKIPTTESIQGLVKNALTEALKDFRPAGGQGEGGGAGGGQGGGAGAAGGGGQSNALEIQVKKLQDQLDSQTKALQRKDEEARQASEKRDRNEEHQALTAALLKNGVPEARARAAAALLFYDQGIIKRNDKKEICITLKKVYAGEAVDEAMPIEAGIAEWVKTAEGKEFLPAVAAGGSGGRGGNPPRQTGAKPTTGEAYGFVADSILNGGVGR